MMTMPEIDQKQRDLMHMGLCPFCEQQIKGWKAPFGSFAPEAWATLREHNIDPSTGHRESCAYKEIRLG